jgi:hypothetical protein
VATAKQGIIVFLTALVGVSNFSCSTPENGSNGPASRPLPSVEFIVSDIIVCGDDAFAPTSAKFFYEDSGQIVTGDPFLRYKTVVDYDTLHPQSFRLEWCARGDSLYHPIGYGEVPRKLSGGQGIMSYKIFGTAKGDTLRLWKLVTRN